MWVEEWKKLREKCNSEEKECDYKCINNYQITYSDCELRCDASFNKCMGW